MDAIIDEVVKQRDVSEEKLPEKPAKQPKPPKGQSRASTSSGRASQLHTVVTAAAAGSNQSATLPQYHITPTIQGASKYGQLLALIDEMGKDIRPSYTGNRNCAERLKKEIIHARVLVRECLLEVERSARNQQQ